MIDHIPQVGGFYNPLLAALRSLGGSASISELNRKVTELMEFSEKAMKESLDRSIGNETRIEYRLGWTRTYLKKYGLITNSSRGIWSLTKKAEGVLEVDPEELVRTVRDADRAERRAKKPNDGNQSVDLDLEDEEHPSWKVELHHLLTKVLTPASFERLVQRLLRESGFIQVEVTGRTGDGGIDGKGIAKIHGIMSFHVVFQCKRYQGSVGSREIRDFRGAMVGRSDKGLFITTGSFTNDAVKEATRDGAPPIDLIDGDSLAEKLRELRLGVKVEMVESVTVDPQFFAAI
jgi:restriction system protein